MWHYAYMATRKKPELSEAEDRARRVLNLVINLTDTSDGAVAERCGWSRQRVEQRRKGDTRLRMGDIDVLAEALSVNPLLFSLAPTDALHFLADHHPDLVSLSSGWFGDSADDHRVLARTG